jgi:hypothetical protein
MMSGNLRFVAIVSARPADTGRDRLFDALSRRGRRRYDAEFMGKGAKR